MYILKQLEPTLHKRGYETEQNFTIKGKSGSTHHFHLTARRNDIEIVFDLSKTLRSEDLVNLLGKKMDIETDLGVFVSREANRALIPLAKSYGLSVLFLNAPEFEKELGKLLR